MAETAKNTAKTDDSAPPGVSFGDDAAPPGVSFGDDTAAPPGVSFGESTTPAKPKDDLSDLTIDPFSGMVISSNAKKNAEIIKRQAEVGKGLAPGAAKTVVGWAQFPALAAPESVQQYLADTQTKLSGVGAKEGQMVGEMLPYLFGGAAMRGIGLAGESAMTLGSKIPGIPNLGEYLAPVVTKAGEYLAPAGEAISTGAKVAKEYAGKMIPESVKNVYGALKGTAPTAEALAAEAAAAPEKITKLRALGSALADIGVETGKGLATGTVGGAAFGAVAPREEATQLERNKARLNAIIEGAEGGALLGGLAGFGGETLKNIVRAKNAASLKDQKKALDDAMAALEKERSRLEGLTTQTYLRSVGAETGADVARKMAEAKLAPMEQKIGELTEAGFEAQAKELAARKRIYNEAGTADPALLAQRADMTVADANALIADHEKYLEKVRADVKNLGVDFSELPTLTPVEQNRIAEQIQASLKDYETSLNNAVKKQSGYSKFESKYKNAGSVFPSEGIKNLINSKLEAGMELTDADYLMTEVVKKIDSKAKDGALSFDQMDEIRKYVNDAIDKGIVQRAGRPRSIAGDELQKLMPLKEEILNSIDSVDKSFKPMLNKHANMKTALDPFSKGNVFEGVTEQKFGKDFAMLPGEALVRILDRTELGGEGVAQWIAQDRTAQDKIRKLLTTEFFPTKDAAAKRTAEDFENFMRKRGNILEKAGLLPEFKDLETMRRTAEQRITSAEEALETAKQKAARTQERTSIEETERQLELDVLKNRADPVRAESQRAVQDLASARSMKDSAERLAGDLRSARIDPENLHTKLEGYIDRLNKYDPEHFTNKMRNDAIEELAKMKKAYTDSRDQLKYDKDLRTYALLRLSTDLGIGLSGYGVYRLGQGPGGH